MAAGCKPSWEPCWLHVLLVDELCRSGSAVNNHEVCHDVYTSHARNIATAAHLRLQQHGPTQTPDSQTQHPGC
jgi:hypothetical protein